MYARNARRSEACERVALCVDVRCVKVVCVKESCVRVPWVKEWCGTGGDVKVLCVQLLNGKVCVKELYRIVCNSVVWNRSVYVCVYRRGVRTYCVLRCCMYKCCG